jgi:hypothetical protein
MAEDTPEPGGGASEKEGMRYRSGPIAFSMGADVTPEFKKAALTDLDSPDKCDMDIPSSSTSVLSGLTAPLKPFGIVEKPFFGTESCESLVSFPGLLLSCL